MTKKKRTGRFLLLLYRSLGLEGPGPGLKRERLRYLNHNLQGVDCTGKRRTTMMMNLMWKRNCKIRVVREIWSVISLRQADDCMSLITVISSYFFMQMTRRRTSMKKIILKMMMMMHQILKKRSKGKPNGG